VTECVLWRVYWRCEGWLCVRSGLMRVMSKCWCRMWAGLRWGQAKLGACRRRAGRHLGITHFLFYKKKSLDSVRLGSWRSCCLTCPYAASTHCTLRVLPCTLLAFESELQPPPPRRCRAPRVLQACRSRSGSQSWAATGRVMRRKRMARRNSRRS
jgi:hypothetical protein